MADAGGPLLEKFCGSDAREWEVWLEDYKTYGDLKKWNKEKLVSNLRFFVSGDVKDCVRQACADVEADATVSLDDVAKEVVKLLGGQLDPISAVRQLDCLVYTGNVNRTILQIQALIPVAYPTLTTKPDKDQMCLLHLLKVMPHSCKHELVKSGVTTLEEAVKSVSGMERADRALGEHAAGLNRVVSFPQPDTPTDSCNKAVHCFVCGLTDHVRSKCPFREDICGKCNKRGHLSVVCRGPGRASSQPKPGRPGNGSWPARGQWQARGHKPAPALQDQRPQPVGNLQQHQWPPHPWSPHQWPQHQWPQQLPHRLPQPQTGAPPTLVEPAIPLPAQQQQQQLQ